MELLLAVELIRSAKRHKAIVPDQVVLDSIRKDGVKSAVLVEDIGKGLFRIIDGQQRFDAAKKLGLTHIPARVYTTERPKMPMGQIEQQLFTISTSIYSTIPNENLGDAEQLVSIFRTEHNAIIQKYTIADAGNDWAIKFHAWAPYAVAFKIPKGQTYKFWIFNLNVQLDVLKFQIP